MAAGGEACGGALAVLRRDRAARRLLIFGARLPVALCTRMRGDARVACSRACGVRRVAIVARAFWDTAAGARLGLAPLTRERCKCARGSASACSSANCVSGVQGPTAAYAYRHIEPSRFVRRARSSCIQREARVHVACMLPAYDLTGEAVGPYRPMSPHLGPHSQCSQSYRSRGARRRGPMPSSNLAAI